MNSDYYYDFGKKQLGPIFKSLSGKGIRKTLNLIKKEFPSLKIKKISSKTNVFDWTVPPNGI